MTAKNLAGPKSGREARSAPSRKRVSWEIASTTMAVMITFVTLTGGSSFADVAGQPVVRTGSLFLVGFAIIAGLRFDFSSYRAPFFAIGAMIAVVAVQLVPLPPTVWLSLPGRSAFDVSTLVPSVAMTWRPAALVPDMAWNALFALLVPASALLLVSAVPRSQFPVIVPLLLMMVILSSVVAAMQFSGSTFDNPLINERMGFASGLLSNRNHQALFLAIGVACAMQWGALRPFIKLRMAGAAALTFWFLLMILATGSRAGLALGGVGLIGGALLILGALRRAGIRFASKTLLLFAAGALLVLTLVVTISLYGGRSESLDRFHEASIGDDMRLRAMPVVLEMARGYLPVGAGQGSFETLFRSAEPDSLLKPTYFNHAHNDYLELAIEGGLSGLSLLMVCLAWLVWKSIQAWRSSPDGEVQRARLGSIVILLVLLASIVDYPARTPLIMMVLVLAAAFLNRLRKESTASLPAQNRHLYSEQSSEPETTGDHTLDV